MQRRRVLVVDDDPDAAEASRMLLSLLGHDCRAASTARDALAVVDEFAPDIAILDIGLPDLSGFDLARELRKVCGDRPMYLAALTGWGQPNDRALALAAGFDQHVLKPADLTKIKEILRSAEQVLDACPG